MEIGDVTQTIALCEDVQHDVSWYVKTIFLQPVSFTFGTGKEKRLTIAANTK